MTSPTTSDSIRYSRRTFLKTGSAAVAGLAVASPAFSAPTTYVLRSKPGAGRDWHNKNNHDLNYT